MQNNLLIYLGKEYLSLDGKFHMRIVGTDSELLTAHSIYSTMPLGDTYNALIAVDVLLKYWIPKTDLANILFSYE